MTSVESALAPNRDAPKQERKSSSTSDSLSMATASVVASTSSPDGGAPSATTPTSTGGAEEEELPPLTDIDGKVIERTKSDKWDTWRCPDPGCKKMNTKGDPACQQCTLPRHSAHQFKRGGGNGFRGGRYGGRTSARDQYNKGYQKQYQNTRRLRIPANVDLGHPVVKVFQEYASIIDEKNDRHERIMKLSRDITADSKKVIFLLHRITSEDQKPTVLYQAEKMLADIKYNLWRRVAYELKGENPYKFRKAFTAGLQEYIEAVSFYHFLCFDCLVQWKEIQDNLTFNSRTWLKSNEYHTSSVSRVKARYMMQDEKHDDSGEQAAEKAKKTNTKDGAHVEAKQIPKQPVEPETAESVDSTEDQESNPKATKVEKQLKREEEPDALAKDEKPSNDDKPAESNELEKLENKAESAPIASPIDKEEQAPTDSRSQDKSHSKSEPKKSELPDDRVTSARGVRPSSPVEGVDYINERIKVLVPWEDYIMGIEDLTGEMMRQAINCVGLGNLEICFQLLDFLHEIHNGLCRAMGATPITGGREVSHKLKTLKQSLQKVEKACYLINVRGCEIPKNMLSTELFASDTSDVGLESTDESIN